MKIEFFPDEKPQRPSGLSVKGYKRRNSPKRMRTTVKKSLKIFEKRLKNIPIDNEKVITPLESVLIKDILNSLGILIRNWFQKDQDKTKY